MESSSKQLADRTSFQTFLNCFLREIDAGVWHQRQQWEIQTGLVFDGDETQVVELQLSSLNTTLAVGSNFHSSVGRHRFTHIYQQQANPFQWQKLSSLSAIMLLIDDIYSRPTKDKLAQQGQQLELIARTIESQQIMEQYLQARAGDPRLQAPGFIAAEQSLLLGHWLHPTPKSRQGLHVWQHKEYSPERCAHFQLHYFAVDQALVREGSILDHSASDMIAQLLAHEPSNTTRDTVETLLADNKCLLPLHPLQAQWLLHQDHLKQLLQQGKIVDCGKLGPVFTPTSSVRTLYCDSLNFMVKLSIPVKITNSLRINMEHELNAGMVVAKLLRQCEFSQRYPQFKTIDDPAYITVQLPDMIESGFEVIFRENPFQQGAAGRRLETIAALTQDYLHQSSGSRLSQLITELAARDQQSVQQVSRQWFDAYWQCAIEPAIRLYDECGIALEAHQQNSLLDISEGYPSCYYYRDNQGFYLSNSQKDRLLKLEPLLSETRDLFYDDALIRDRFSYYLIINQLFSIINRFGLDGLISEHELLQSARHKLLRLQPQCHSGGVEFIRTLLQRSEIPCKGNLLTRIEDVDELQAELEQAVYTHIRNPLQLNESNTNELNALFNKQSLSSATNHEVARESA